MKNKQYILSIIMVLFSACGSSSDSTSTSIFIEENTTGFTEENTTRSTEENTSSTIKIAYTPATISIMLEANQTVSWELLSSSPSNLTHFSMSELDNNDIIVLSDSNTSVNATLTVDTNMKTETSISALRLLNGLFQFVETSTSGVFYISSLKHSNYALDIASSSSDVLRLQDFRSGSKDTSSSAYLLFTVSSSGTGYVLTATGRMTYDTTSSSFTEDSTWSSKTVIYQNNTLELSSSTSSVLSFYKAGLDLTIPIDFNPDSTLRVSNNEVTPKTKDDDTPSQTPDKVVDPYKNQVTTSGLNTSTTTAATTMLSTIVSTLSAENRTMRYSSDFYLALRKSLLSRSINFSDSTDGTLGQLTNPYVFFTNEADSNGDHHPFMVIASYGLPESLALLWDIAKPPGDGLTRGYNTQEVTRSFHKEGFLTKIPLRDYGEVSSLTENTMEGSLADDVGETDYDNLNYASKSATGMAIDGVLIYPSYNNVLDFSQTHAELSAQGLHSGRGLGVHYHADAHSATHSELNLYNSSDYTGQTHPPLVSIGFDGVAGYGIYKSGDTTSDGVSSPLDAYGGHEHDDYGYHYHAYTKSETSSDGKSYTVHTLPPQGAWGGKINDIPEFWDGTAPNYVGGRSSYLGTE